jgi:hypothetical protein
MDKLDGRTLVELRRDPSRTGWQDDADFNANQISDALARSDAPLFEIDQQVIWVHEGRSVPVTGAALSEIVDKYLAAPVLIDCDTAEAPNWILEAQPLNCPRAGDVYRRVLTAKSRNDGGLIWRMPKLRVSEPVAAE